jgi:phosphocarrier protein FPr/phosphocarrier protein
MLDAPLSGWLIPIDAVPDPVFSGRILGDGFAIDPTEATLKAPFAATVTSVHRARHAVTLKADNGAEILMHIGLDTVSLKGEGFVAHVAEGDRVKPGDPLLTFDMDVVAQLVRSLVVPIVLTSGEAFVFEPLKTEREVVSGAPLVRIVPAAAVATKVASSGTRFTKTVRIADPHGIHARPAGLIAEIAKSASSEVMVRFGDRTASAASPVGLLLLGAACGDELTIEAEGADAEATVTAIAARIESAAAQAPAAAVTSATPAAPLTPDAVAMIADGMPLDITGVTGAPGTAVGVSLRLVQEAFEVAETGGDVETELAGLRQALNATAATLAERIASSSGKQAEILAAHLAFVEDPDLRQAAWALIREGTSAAFAWKRAVEAQASALRKLGNPVLAERAADLEDICRQVLRALFGKSESEVVLPPGAVIFADDLLPSQFAELDTSKIAGLVLAGAGPTAHIAILAASKGIPAVVVAGANALRVPDGQKVIVTADNASARVNPPAAEYDATIEVVTRRKARREAGRAATMSPCVMADGTRIEVVANLGGPADVEAAVESGAEGCGLMRSEFLFLNRATAPSEDEQFAQYQAMAKGLGDRPLIIRTLDAGADKDVPYMNLPAEENPALGLRGVRMSLWQPELLRQQIRAILRVEPYGQAKILLPMVATLADLREVRRVIDAEMAALGRTFPIQVGIMIEVPSAALIAERFAAEVDFFSVGTNDLTQYTLAIDRVNARLAKQLDAYHPAVLRLIGLAAEGARAKGKWVGVCGSLASFPLAAPLLIGLGVTELSATAGSIPEIKAFVRTLNKSQCVAAAQQALSLESGDAVRRLLHETWPEA